MRTTLFVLALLVAPVALADSAAPREATARYFGSASAIAGSLLDLPDCSSDRNLAGACFDFFPTEGNATITATDDRGAQVCFDVSLKNETAEHHTLFCGQGRVSLRTISETTTLRVLVGRPGLTSMPPTEGTIRVVFDP